MKINKGFLYAAVCLALAGILVVMNILFGNVSIPMEDIWAVLLGKSSGTAAESYAYIILQSRLPQAFTALLAGMALSVSGLLLQTTFRNPLAGPDVFGISSGASLAVALVMLTMGGTVQVGGSVLGGYLALLAAAFTGAMVVIALISLFSVWIKNHVVLLIVGIMIGYLAGSAISLLNFFASADGVKNFVVWGMGSFGNVTVAELPWLGSFVLGGLLLAMLLVKPLNVFLLGDLYAASLGFSVSRVRLCLLLVSGFLTASATAFCGPVSFIGLVTPHIARMLLSTDNHRRLLPFTMLLGGCLCLLCNLLCTLPSASGVLPLNAITPLLGAPVVIYILLKQRME